MTLHTILWLEVQPILQHNYDTRLLGYTVQYLVLNYEILYGLAGVQALTGNLSFNDDTCTCSGAKPFSGVTTIYMTLACDLSGARIVLWPGTGNEWYGF